MRYEDASQTGSAGSDVSARDDSEHLAGNDFGPATGNLITGSGTVSGAAGTDSVGAGAHITAIAGPGGSDNTFDANGMLQVAGQYGTLTIDAEGNYTYVRNPGSPEGVTETFTYTLADAAGATDTANLVVNIGNLPMLQAQGNQTIQTANGVVVLPAGVELSDVRVVGRDLVITLPDGSTMVIPDGAIFVPELVVNGVEVPASNLAALLIDSEPKPAAGDASPSALSSGGNFEVPVQPLDPGVPLGDLIPPTELNYTPPEFEDLFPGESNEPPVIGVSSVNVSEEGVSIIAPPIPDTSGSPDTTNSATNGGTIPVSDADGDSLTLTLGVPSAGLTSQGVAITWSVSGDGHTLTGSAGGNTVITLVLNDNGNYTVTLLRPVDHPTAGGEQGTSFVVPVSASDGEDVTTGGAITVTIEDDSPVVSNVTAQGGVTLDETTAGSPAGFPISDTTSGPVIVNSSGGFGADGPAVANATVYGIGLTGGVSSLASGLATAVGDFPITLVQIDGDTIQGQYTNGGTQVAFIIQMNGDGSVTLTQNVALEHLTDGPPGPAHDDSLSLAGLVNATVQLTDRDGDVATGSAPIGGGLVFRDDGPDAQVAEAQLDTIVLDETRPEGSDTSGAGAPSGDASATANFADNFVSPVDYGADGAGSVSYQLLLSANGIGSGLYALDATDTSAGDGDGIGQGAEITLSLTGNTITGSAGGTNYFTISLDANTGVATFTQLNPIWHPTPGTSYDEAASLLTESASDIQVQQTVTDSDGDFDSATVNIGRGVFSIQDDGPTAAADPQATLDTIVLDETRPEGTDTSGAGAPSGDASATANFADNFVASGDYGADGPGSASYQLLLSANGIGSGLYALDATDTSAGDGDGIGQGAEITLSQVGNVITGSAGGTDYFTISIAPATGVVTFTQLNPIWHPTPGTSYDEAAALNTASAANVQVQQTLTDADGDTDTATVDIGQGVFSIQDDGPNAAVDPQATLDTVVLDETRPEGSDTAGAGAPSGDASATANFADNFVAGGDYGADGPGSATYQLLLSASGIGSGLYALDATDTSAGDGDGIGQGAEITLSQVGNVITGSAGAQITSPSRSLRRPVS
jgi:T1SS-143 domain-containing protein